MTPEVLIARLLHRDASVLILDKPAGLPVHPGPKGGETLTDHLDDLRFGLKWRPELAHRLDKDTSGCLAMGRHPRALRDLNELFRTGKAKKLYWAVVEGGPTDEAGLIDIPLAKKSPDRGWWMKPDPDGLPSQTAWRVLGRGEGSTWLELEPLTGRTHQLRAHCAAMGFPILGDAIYGGAARDAALHLHARSLDLPLHPKKPPIVAQAPAPSHMRDALARCGWSEQANERAHAPSPAS